MALFSRRRSSAKPEPSTPDTEAPGAVTPAAPSAATGSPDIDATSAEADAPADAAPPAETAPTVGISVSAYRGVGAPAGPPVSEPAASESTPSAPGAGSTSENSDDAAPRVDAPSPRRAVPAEAPPPSESIPGLRDNVLLAQALGALPETPDGAALMNVARQLLQGHIFLRVHGDARALLSEGKPLPMMLASRDDRQFVLVFSSGTALQDSVRADGQNATSALGQPVLTVLRHVLAGPYEGIVIDNASAPARAVLPRPILQKAVDDADTALRVKTLLSGPRSGATAAEVSALLPDVPLWIAVKRAEEGGRVGVAESRGADGARYLEVFSHPLEVLALGRGDQALPVTISQVAKALDADAAIAGILLDPGGPWLRLTRDDLAAARPADTR